MASSLQDAVRSRWCAARDYCDGRHGQVWIGALTGRAVLQNNLTTAGLAFIPKTLRCWRQLVGPALGAVAHSELGGGAVSAGPIYTFGIYEGASMYYYRHVFGPSVTLIGFDSLTGLPMERKGEVRRATWTAGLFGVEHREPRIVERIYADLGGRSRNRIVRGYFNESLTSELATTMRVASLVDIDSDLYVSAYQALDWLFAHGLVAKGTLVAYDDWADYACAPLLAAAQLRTVPAHERADSMSVGTHPLMKRDTKIGRLMRAAALAGSYPPLLSAGEPKAHVEISSKYRVKFRCVAGSCKAARPRGCDTRAYGAIFVIESIGLGEADHGIELLDGAPLDAFRKSDITCKFVRHHRFTTSWADAPRPRPDR